MLWSSSTAKGSSGYLSSSQTREYSIKLANVSIPTVMVHPILIVPALFLKKFAFYQAAKVSYK